MGAGSDQRQHKRAWDNSNPFPEPEAGEAMTPDEGVSLNDFRAYMPTHSYIYMPTRDMWPGASVNARVPPVPMFNADGTLELDNKGQEFMSPARYLDDQKPVEQMTWAPGLPMLIPDRIASCADRAPRPGCRTTAWRRYDRADPGQGQDGDGAHLDVCP